MPIKILEAYDTSSIPFRFRRKRFEFFTNLLNTIPKPVRILDVGGTQQYWESMGFNEADIHITLCNLFAVPITNPNFASVTGDATNLSQYKDKEFDLVFSNSVIEHLFTFSNQIKMANEIRRIGKRYYVQTPNYYFPIEPHWLFPLFQFLPKFIRVALSQYFTLGNQPATHDRQKAIKRVEEIQLLTQKEMRQLFPESRMHKEKFLGLVKSFSAYYFP